MDIRFAEWSGRIKKSEKTAFLSAFVSGMLAHLYIYTNTIPNFDGISRVYEEQQMTISGRWFLHYASWLHGFTQMPMVIGILSMLFLSAAAVLIIRIFRIESNIVSGIWGCMSVTFPAVAYTNTYTFTASAYSLAIFLAVAGLWITKSKKWGIAVGVCLLALSMGTYQVYAACTITLSVLLVFRDLLEGKKQTKEIFLSGIHSILYISLGTIIYYIILKIFLWAKDLQLLSYLGMDEVAGSYPFNRFSEILAETYRGVWDMFLGTAGGFGEGNLLVLHILLLVVCGALLVILIKRNKVYEKPVHLAGLIFMIILLPTAVNFGQIMSPLSIVSPIMKYAFVYLYFLPLLLLEMSAEKMGDLRAVKGVYALTLAAVLFCSAYYWQYGNMLYTMLNQAHRATLSYASNLLSRIESCEGYKYGMDVVIVGTFPDDRYYTEVEGYGKVEQGGALSSSVIPLNKHIYYYLQDWLNVPVDEPEEAVFLMVTNLEEFRDMPLYPDNGSVRIMNGCVVVKVQENYTPRAQYEKDYEQRR